MSTLDLTPAFDYSSNTNVIVNFLFFSLLMFIGVTIGVTRLRIVAWRLKKTTKRLSRNRRKGLSSTPALCTCPSFWFFFRIVSRPVLYNVRYCYGLVKKTNEFVNLHCFKTPLCSCIRRLNCFEENSGGTTRRGNNFLPLRNPRPQELKRTVWKACYLWLDDENRVILRGYSTIGNRTWGLSIIFFANTSLIRSLTAKECWASCGYSPFSYCLSWYNTWACAFPIFSPQIQLSQ